MIEKDKLKEYAQKLMFDMDEKEYETLQKEFDVIIRRMDVIDKIPNLHVVKPMSFPFLLDDRSLRNDEVGDYLTVGEVLSNTKHQVNDQVKVPKVVEE